MLSRRAHGVSSCGHKRRFLRRSVDALALAARTTSVRLSPQLFMLLLLGLAALASSVVSSEEVEIGDVVRCCESS